MSRKQLKKPYKYSTGKSYLATIYARHCSTRLPLVSIHAQVKMTSFRRALKFMQGSHKMGRPMDCFQATSFFIAESFVAWKWENVVLFNEKYFERNIFYFTISISDLLFYKKRRELSCTPNKIVFASIKFIKLIIKLNYGDNWFLQEDNAPVHQSRKVQYFVMNSGISALEWPAKSPNLNIVKDCWKTISDLIYDGKQFINKEDLLQKITNVIFHLNQYQRQKVLNLCSAIRS